MRFYSTILAVFLVAGYFVFSKSGDPLKVPSKALRISGSSSCFDYRIDGKTLITNTASSFQLDIDESGRWFMVADYTSAPGTRYSIGYDGTNTIEMENYSGVFQHADDTNKTERLTFETSTSVASIYPGNEFPFDLWPPSIFAWLTLASHGYQSDTNHLGRIGDLEKHLPYNPIAFAIKLKPTFREEWPKILEKGELTFDMRDYPKYPIGLESPDSDMDYRIAENLWKKVQAKKSGMPVGRMTSGDPKAFGDLVIPTRFRMETTWRGTDVPDNSLGIDNLHLRFDLVVTNVQAIEQVVGRPEFIGPGVLVKDYRFRHVDADTVMEYLGYNITDKKWKSANDPVLMVRAAHNRARSPRFGNLRNRSVKWIGSILLFFVFLYPLLRRLFNYYRTQQQLKSP